MNFKIRERHFLKSKLIRKLRQIVKNEFLTDPNKIIPKNSQVEQIKFDEITLFTVNGDLLLINFENKLLPSINAILKNKLKLPKVTIDKGAISHITNGADVMIPGITKVDPDIKKNSYVIVVEETHEKPLAIGKAIINAEEIKNRDKGVAVHNIHYVGDKIWNFIRTIHSKTVY